jgi:hypothetical protein
MSYFFLEPEAAGWDYKSVADWQTKPPVIRELNHEFDFWLGDALLESVHALIVTGPPQDGYRSRSTKRGKLRQGEGMQIRTVRGAFPGPETSEFCLDEGRGQSGARRLRNRQRLETRRIGASAQVDSAL